MGRRKKIQPEEEGWKKSFDWSIDPETTKEIFSILAFALGVLFFLAEFGGAGRFGDETLIVLNNLFGLAGFMVPVALFVIGWTLWKAKAVKVKGPTIIGLMLLFIFVPALFFGSGGSIGETFSNFFSEMFGMVAGFLITLALAIASMLLATNLSIIQVKNVLFPSPPEEEGSNMEPRVSVFQTVRERLSSRSSGVPVAEAPSTAAPAALKNIYNKNWIFPPFDLLPYSTTKATPGNITKNVEMIQKTFKDFGVDVAMSDVHIGPTVTQYTLKPAEGVKVQALTARSDDLALALAAHPIRMEAPIPGKAAVGIEVPNKTPAIVTLREILESDSLKNAKSNLALAIGRDVAGAPFAVDLRNMPHLLIAGSTGAGKSVAINSIILSLLFQNSPADLRMILIDPKRVEFTMYNGIPHLLTPVVIEVDKIINTLKWTVAEMERRYKVFSETHKRNITEYNTENKNEPMPYIIVIIDELADLMMQAANEAESAIVRLSQLARATGIHLIVATQRPSVDVITGLIKANIATRIAFAVASQIDSRTIIDQAGAEKLLGRGDMLYLGNELGKPKRVQGVLVGEKEIKAVTDFLKREGSATYEESIQNYRPAGSVGGRGGDSNFEDALYEDAKQIVVSHGKASATLLQTRMRVGYARAARLLQALEEDGIIGPADGSKPRDVIISPSQLSAAPARQPATPVYNQAPNYYPQQPQPQQQPQYPPAPEPIPAPEPEADKFDYSQDPYEDDKENS